MILQEMYQFPFVTEQRKIEKSKTPCITSFRGEIHGVFIMIDSVLTPSFLCSTGSVFIFYRLFIFINPLVSLFRCPSVGFLQLFKVWYHFLL